MTGYGLEIAKNESLNLSIQVKTVNNRFLEVRYRAPYDYLPFEGEVKKLAAQYLSRGTAEISIHRTRNQEAPGTQVSVNLGLGKAWAKACKELQEPLNLSDRAVENLVLKAPDLVSVADSPVADQDEKQMVLETLRKALEKCGEERKREGEALKKHLSSLLKQMNDFVSKTSQQKEERASLIKEKFTAKIQSLGEQFGEGTLDPSRLAQEALFLIEKTDIDEELKRLQAHTKAYEGLLDKPGVVGKKLEFYTQEMHREVNTIGSKSQALDLVFDVIEAKTIVERLREQVQNIE